jgi:hypothetical protein
MKISIYMLFMLLFGCGQQTAELVSSDQQNVTIQNEQDVYSVSFIVPNPMMLGGAKRIEYNNKSYLIGSQTPNSIQNILYAYPEGTHLLNLQGVFDRESGNFPNPTAEFDVMHVQSIE